MMPGARIGAGAIGYLAAFVFLTWPLAWHADASLAAEYSPDLEHSLWAQWWFATAVQSPEYELYRSRMVDFPWEVDLQLADLNLAVNLAFYGLGRFVGMAAAWNVSLLASFLLAALLTQRLATRLGAHPTAAWVGGLCYAGSPYWTASVLNGWCYLVHVWPLPLCCLAALGLRERGGARAGAWLGASLGLAFHVTPYYFLQALVLLALLAALRLPELRAWLRRRDTWEALAAAAAVTALLVAPRALAMAASADRELVVHHGALNTALAAPLLELFWPSPAAVTSRLDRVRYLVPFVGWSLPLAIALGLWAGGRAAGSGVRRSVGTWLAAAAGALLLALGPRLVWAHGEVTPIPLPGALLQRLPGFDVTTNHWRWSLAATLCLAMALARAWGPLERLAADHRPALARGLAPLLVLAWALEVVFVWPLPHPRPLWEVSASPVAARLRERSDVQAVLDRTDRRKLNQTIHGKPIALGWLPRVDRETQRANQRMVARCAGRDPSCLRAYGIDAVIRDAHTALLLGEDGRVREVLRAGPARHAAGPGPTQ